MSRATVAFLMGAKETFIGTHPRDGREYDCQCARCGSTLTFETCAECAGDGYIEDDDDATTCITCDGKGSWPLCISSEEFCEANPLPRRIAMRRSTPEWFATSGAATVGREHPSKTPTGNP